MKKQKTNLVIGNEGEVGSAVQEILNCEGIDFQTQHSEKFDVLHVCFPYSDKFVEAVKQYQKQYEADLVVVHSTVPLYTCDLNGWVHSPVRGVHPNMVHGLKTFVKYFGGKRAMEAASPWAALGIEVKTTMKAAETEALKLWDTAQYGVMIMLEKEIHAWCKKHDLDPELVYTDANHTYDIGYEKLNRPEVARPYLKHMDGPIGGHCVIPNCDLLDSPITAMLKQFNDRLKTPGTK